MRADFCHLCTGCTKVNNYLCQGHWAVGVLLLLKIFRSLKIIAESHCITTTKIH